MKTRFLLIILAVLLTACNSEQSEKVDHSEEKTVHDDSNSNDGDEKENLHDGTVKDGKIEFLYDIESVQGETEEIRLLKSLNSLFYNLGDGYSDFESFRGEDYNDEEWDHFMQKWSNDMKTVWDDIESNKKIRKEVNEKMLIACENLNDLGDLYWNILEADLDKKKEEKFKQGFMDKSVELGEIVNQN
ncbi:hypothetical protein WMZ97_06170 [Lentibacillus sp. N15]|uniref:hypothetical protein n=1 Tax=Lentibacillus songyuanensis TaxID=3136161 RepID=UPI0031BB71A2